MPTPLTNDFGEASGKVFLWHLFILPRTGTIVLGTDVPFTIDVKKRLWEHFLLQTQQHASLHEPRIMPKLRGVSEPDCRKN